jgi:hypothetical protein
MTIPENDLLPIVTDFKSYQDVTIFLRALLFALEERDDEIIDVVNGSIRADVFTDMDQWIPYLYGTTTPGTFTYTKQTGWSLRQGLYVDIWFDLQWTANAGSVGNLYLQLPYIVANSNNMPFVGTIQSSTIVYGAGQTVLTINAIPNTYRGEIWSSGSGNATANIGIPAAGRLIGHLRYIGQRNE